MPWDQYGSPIGEDVTNPLIVSPIGGSIVSEVMLAKGVTDAAGTTSQFADGTKNFETGAFVGKTAKLTIDDVAYYRTILSNTGGTVIINPIVDAVKAKAIIGEVSGGQVTVEYDTAGSAGNDFSVQCVPIVINSLPTTAQLIAEYGLIVVYLGTGADGLAASTTIGSGADGVVTITYYTEGTIGNSYTVEAVLAGEASADMAVDLDTSGLTPKLIITLGTDGDGLIDASKNTAALVAAQIDTLNNFTATASGNGSTAIAVTAEKNLENGTDPTIIATGSDVATAISLIEGFTATMTGAGGIVAPTTEDISFTGGIDAITIPTGTEYEILDYGLVNKFVPTDTGGDEKFTAGNPASVQVSGSNTAKRASDTITRGNVADPYSAGDVVSTVAGEVMEFASVGVANQIIAVLGTRMRVDLDAAVTAGITGYRLHLYNAAPTAIADNAAFNIPATDRAKYLGYVPISTPIRFDDTQWAQDDGINATFKLAGTSLFGILETLGAYTPTANAVKTIFLDVAGV